MEEEAETTADVSLGRDFAISTLADFEASSEVSWAKSNNNLLSNRHSFDNEEDKRAFFWPSDNEGGKSLAKCSLLRSLKKAKSEEDKVIASAIEPPKNLLIELKSSGSAGSNPVFLISFERTSNIHPP